MKIGFDFSQTGKNKAGCGFVADGLIRQFADHDRGREYVLYPTFGNFYWDVDWAESVFRTERPNFQRGLAHQSLCDAKEFWWNPPEDVERQLGEPDVIHANNFFCPTRRFNARLVYTLYDLSFLDHPEWTTERNRIGCFTGVFNAAQYADWIVTISEYSKRHFLDTFPHYPAERISVVYPASRFEAGGSSTRSPALADLRPNEFWLSVGTIEPRKNHRSLLHAYARLKARRGKTYPLVMAGGSGWLMDEFQQTVDDLGVGDDVRMLGYVDDASLQWLYEHCFALVYPSYFEGFGLPVLEAMSRGAAVITSRTTSLPEIVGDAGLLVDPHQVDDVCRAMKDLLEGRADRMRLKQMARGRAKQFSWSQAAQQVLDVYDQVVRAPKLAAA